MNTPHPQLNEIFIDDLPIIIPTDAGWVLLLQDLVLNGLPIYSRGMEKLFNKTLDFVDRYKSDFSLGLHQFGKLPRWLVVPLLKISGELQRVQIERIICNNCSWEGMAANPREGSLYYGPNRLTAVDRALARPLVSCPQCGGILPRPAIWTEPSNK